MISQTVQPQSLMQQGKYLKLLVSEWVPSVTQPLMSVLSMNPLPGFEMQKVPGPGCWSYPVNIPVLMSPHIWSFPASPGCYSLLAEGAVTFPYFSFSESSTGDEHFPFIALHQHKNPDSWHYFGIKEEDVFFFHRTPICLNQGKTYCSTCGSQW